MTVLAGQQWVHRPGGVHPLMRPPLEMLAERLEDVVPAVEDGGLAEITEYLDGVCTILEGDTSIPLELRAHINEVIGHVRWCVDN
ncbi:hypothetical protein [Mycobacterium haemophilum]|uniref:hypothetical protein n=2 Tax=Mycobacterium haemophilum TaxID=29311 RepID=UPI001E3CF840|nr:hypothetical protein [Mycobacterium haemophilum]